MIPIPGGTVKVMANGSASLEASMLVLVESKMIANPSVIDALVLYAGTPHAPVRHVIKEKRYAVIFPEIVPYF